MQVQVNETALQAEMARQIVARLDFGAAVAKARGVLVVAVRELIARPAAKAIAAAEGIPSYEIGRMAIRADELVAEMMGDTAPVVEAPKVDLAEPEAEPDTSVDYPGDALPY